ncbi:hypothetical protein [Kitasatospora sp. NPDC127060]|uniref:hypothetical protein n=1 Tax=Kitasatospora sp. NPDC127060 TaxID=3347121 RepID=UPI00364EB4DB
MSVTVPPAVIRDPRHLADYLNVHEMPGRRSMTAITRLRRERAKLRPLPVVPESVEVRAQRRVLAAAVAEIERRGGETEIVSESTKVRLHIAVRDVSTGMMLLRAEGWRYYSRRFGHRRAELAYVVGRDDAGPWAVRVPGTMTTLRDALAWMEPAEVTKARAAGRRVWRQGDVYAIETTAAHDGRGVDLLPDAHEWRPGTRYLVHRPEDGRRHRPLKLTPPVRFVRQRVLEMGRSGARAFGD